MIDHTSLKPGWWIVMTDGGYDAREVVKVTEKTVVFKYNQITATGRAGPDQIIVAFAHESDARAISERLKSSRAVMYGEEQAARERHNNRMKTILGLDKAPE